MQVKITYNLARLAAGERAVKAVYHTNAFIKMVDSFCRLKAFAGYSSCIKSYRKRRAEICAELEIKQSTMYHRIAWMEKEGWLTTDGQQLRLTSWYNLHQLLGIEYNKKFFTKPAKINDETTTHYWIYLAEIQDNKNRQAYLINKKLSKNHECIAALHSALKEYGSNMQRCNEDNSYYLSELQQLYYQGFMYGSETYDLLKTIRPDCNRSVIGLGKAWCNLSSADKLLRYNNQQLFNRIAMQASYIKKKMKAECVAIIQKIGTIESEVRARNNDCYVMYNSKNKTTFQAFCDDILPRPQVDVSALKLLENAA